MGLVQVTASEAQAGGVGWGVNPRRGEEEKRGNAGRVLERA